ncbi:MAG: 16S rRNA (cytidine(1402)-2'-O)-methyltransferase [Actinomycetes bacterium]
MLLLAAIPLGNPKDASISLREAIVTAKFIAAEDSRKFTRLCHDLDVVYNAKVISFFEGNEIERIDELVGLMISGEDLLVVTDAGMPGISDPGYRLVRAAVEKNIQVKVLPGPSAVTTALVLSGLPSDRFCFEGFPPRTSGTRQKWFADLAEEPRTMIYFEAPHRLLESLEDAVLGFGGERPAAICREMTKTYEEVVRGSLSDLAHWAAEREILGEITVVVQGFDVNTRTVSADDLVRMVLDRESAGASRKEAIALVVAETAIAKRTVFDAMVAFKGSAKNSAG